MALQDFPAHRFLKARICRHHPGMMALQEEAAARQRFSVRIRFRTLKDAPQSVLCMGQLERLEVPEQLVGTNSTDLQ